MIVTDILCFFSCLKIILCYPGAKTVYFVIEGGGWIDGLAKNFLSMLGWQFIALEYTLSPVIKKEPLFDIRVELDLFFYKYIAPKIQKQITANTCFSEYESKRVFTFLEYLSKKELYRNIELLYVIRCLGENKDNTLNVLLAKSQWSDEVKRAFKRSGYDVGLFSLPFYCNFRRRKQYLMDSLVRQSFRYNMNFIFKMAYLFFNITRDFLACIFFRFFLYFKPSFPRSIGIFDIVAHVPGYNRTEWFNDLFWKNNLEKNYRTLAVLFGSYDKSAYASYGYLADGWVSLNKDSRYCRIFSIFYWLWPIYPKVLIRNLVILLKGFFKAKVKNYYWFEVIKLYIEISKMEALFRITKNKIFWTSIEGQEMTTVAGAMAINRLNGVAVGSTWSMPSFPEFGIYKNAVDVFFIWGKRHFDIYRNEVCKTLIISGYPGDFYLRDCVKRAICLREAWRKEYGAQTIICCYDNIIGNDIQHFTPAVSEYFKSLLQWVRKSPDKLLIIKTKHNLNYYPDSLLKEFKILESQKKLIFEFQKADLSPGFASDVVTSPGISTLACLLAAYGKDVFLLDVNGINGRIPVGISSIAYIDGPGNIAESLENWLSDNKKSTDSPSIGVTTCPGRLDPFLDGLASKRIAGYIADLLSGFNKGLDANTAIQNAGVIYGGKWGFDNVINTNMFDDGICFNCRNEACVN